MIQGIIFFVFIWNFTDVEMLSIRCIRDCAESKHCSTFARTGRNHPCGCQTTEAMALAKSLRQSAESRSPDPLTRHLIHRPRHPEEHSHTHPSYHKTGSNCHGR